MIEHPGHIRVGDRLIKTKDVLDALGAQGYFIKKLHPSEPAFLLRAQDQTAPEAVKDWMDRAERFGVPQEKIERAAMDWAAMGQWTGQKKLPD